MTSLIAWARSPTAAKIFSFAVIGVGNSAIDFGMFTLAYQVFGLQIIPANLIAWIVAVSCSYVMNTMITFRAESGRVLRRKDYLSFVASGVLGMIANTITLLVLSNYIPVYAAKIVAIFSAFIVNFAMSHFVVFRAKPNT